MNPSPSPTTSVEVRTLWARRLSASGCLALTSRQFSLYLDTAALPGGLRHLYRIPSKSRVGGRLGTRLEGEGVLNPKRLNDQNNVVDPDRNVDEEDLEGSCTYLCGNSLGLQNTRAGEMVLEEMDVWADRAVLGHFDHPYSRNWKDMAELCIPTMSTIVGALQSEVAICGTLTTNIHTLMASFYRPTPTRFKILFESRAFPSDQYAFASQAQLHGFNPDETCLTVSPRQGEWTLRTEDIISTIKREGSSIALVMFSGVQYYTGQAFEMEKITAAAHKEGCKVGWDLAHAAGNVPLSLHHWGVDFAAWCTYKYLNSGPGGIAAIFVHERWHNMEGLGQPRLAGWYGHNPVTRFEMPPVFEPAPGALQFVHSNPSSLATVSLLSSLQVFASYNGGIKSLRQRSEELTMYLEQCLLSLKNFTPLQKVSTYDSIEPSFTIITPSTPLACRGAQLSLLFLPMQKGIMVKVFKRLIEFGIVGDEREPDVIRLAPTPMYNTFEDCRKAAEGVGIALDEISFQSKQAIKEKSNPVKPRLPPKKPGMVARAGSI